LDNGLNMRVLLNRLKKYLQILVTKDLEDFGLTAPQLFVIKQIYREPKTIGQITKALGLSYSTVSGIIDRLERENYVVRIRDEQDRRVVWIKKAEKLDEIQNQVPYFQDDFYIQLFEGIPEDKMKQIKESLQLLVSELEKKVEEKE